MFIIWNIKIVVEVLGKLSLSIYELPLHFQYKQNCNSVQIADYTYVYNTAKLLNYIATALKYQVYENEFQPPTS